jgi:cytoplasmic iron level regulating protein YaaA (DUF328/UPF0246 family)
VIRYGALTSSLCSPAVLVLLPPLETKASGGDGSPFALDRLPYSELTPVRRRLIDELVALAGDAPAGLAALKLSERQSAELERNADLWTAPTLPAVQRYTGVLYAALDAHINELGRYRFPVLTPGSGLRPLRDPQIDDGQGA